jgi:hypothetical protein
MQTKPTTPIDEGRRRRRLINRRTSRLQLHLFDDRSKDAAVALAESKAGLSKLGAQA